MATKQFSNGAQSTCASAISSTQTSIVLASAAQFSTLSGGSLSAGEFYIRIDDTGSAGSTKVEYCLCTLNTQANNTLGNLTRGADGSSPQSFAPGATISQILNRQTIIDAFARVDTASLPISVATSPGVAAAPTTYGSMPVKLDEVSPTTADFNFISPLPTSFRHLMIESYARCDAGTLNQPFYVYFNGSQAATYNTQQFFWQGTTSTLQEVINGTGVSVGFIPGSTALAANYGISTIFIKHYNGAAGNKLVNAQGVWCEGQITALTRAFRFDGQWQITATPITKLNMRTGAGNFVPGSLFTLYGIP